MQDFYVGRRRRAGRGIYSSAAVYRDFIDFMEDASYGSWIEDFRAELEAEAESYMARMDDDLGNIPDDGLRVIAACAESGLRPDEAVRVFFYSFVRPSF